MSSDRTALAKGDRNFYDRLLRFIENQAVWIIALNSVIIIVLTLMPFNFAVPLNFSWRLIISQFTETTYIFDILVNILFFFPFGFGWGAYLNRQKKKPNILSSLSITLIISFFLSLSVEIGQLFLISREPTITDLITNSFGGFLGTAFFLCLKIFTKFFTYLFHFFSYFQDRYFQLRIFSLLWVLYFILMASLLLEFQGTNNLSNWSDRFYLIVGNEMTGNRPWQGKVAYLCVTDNSFSEQQLQQLLQVDNACEQLKQTQPDNLITYYSFLKQRKYYVDLAQKSPPLKARRLTDNYPDNLGVTTNKNNWLISTSPTIKINQTLQKNSQFTIFSQISTSDLEQEGPARIISISKDHFLRNITIAQSRKDLSFRLRMPFTGTNGKKPEIRFNNFFTDTNYQQLAISYDGVNLRFKSDRIERSKNLYLGSEAALFWSIFILISERMYLIVNLGLFNKILYYSFIFAPLGILFGSIVNLLKTSSLGFFSLLFLGLVIPPTIIEGIIISTSDRAWHWSYFGLGFIILSLNFLGTKIILKNSSVSINSSANN